MAILTIRNLSVGFGGPALLDGIDLQIEPGERICLIGRNGTGKSTLLKIIQGELIPDEGEINRQDGLGIAYLSQEVPQHITGSVYDVVAEGLGAPGKLLRDYHHTSLQLAEHCTEALLKKLERIQHELENVGGWEITQRVETVLTRMQLPPDSDFAELSGGLKRRVLLARALITEPDLLLLDEPTNHLDIEGITWLEEFLLSYAGTLLFITHDRMFLDKLATRLIELDRGQLTSWPGNYRSYVQRKQAALEAEANQQAQFDKKLAQEEAWIRQGIKARRTRNEGRVRALEALREQRQARRSQIGKAKMQMMASDTSGKLVVEAEHVGFDYAGRTILQDFSTTILRGDKIGIIGPNGAGKTTLLNILLGRLAPQRGTIRFGTRLEIAYFDQHRAQLDEEQSVLDNVSDGREYITVNGASRHIMGYLQDFLFSPQRARTPVKALSGGERNRLLLAKLFTKPSNLLVMDEPTNDLDMETLDLLQELLLEYPGTLLLVSHDRAFINSVVTSTLVFEGNGQVNEYVGGYDDWLRQRPATTAMPGPAQPPAGGRREKPVTASTAKKVSYKDQRELDALPQRIEALEQELQQLHAEMADPGFYQQPGEVIAGTKTRLGEVEQELEAVFQRWEELEA